MFLDRSLNWSTSAEETISDMKRSVLVATLRRKPRKESEVPKLPGLGILEQGVLEMTYKKRTEYSTLLEARCNFKDGESATRMDIAG